ncbi:hypothetical protein [Clostridioides difficile]|uniref:hypothetical protein n=1 Tax=Clostridioides difficile TaxID=1496 RepID=UPI002E8E2B15|nr:hypothetical protein [Clostridioides difficile]
MKKILVACGAGIATSTIVCDRVERLVKKIIYKQKLNNVKLLNVQQNKKVLI